MNKLKNLTAKILISAALLSSLGVPSAFAQGEGQGSVSKQIRQDVRNDRKDLAKDMRSLKQQTNLVKGSVIGGKVTAINGTSFTVLTKSGSVTVNTDTTTKFKRHYWGLSSISDISVEDKVNVWGQWTDTSKTTINATLVRDLSIAKRFGAFIGTITSKSSNGFVLVSKNRGTQTVTFASSVKITNRKEQAISLSDIQLNDRVRVKGMWDKTNNTITEVTNVKDFTLPVISPTPTE